MTNGCLLLVIEMQSDVWQEIPDFDGTDVEQKWIEKPWIQPQSPTLTPTNEDCKRARTLVMIPGWGWFLRDGFDSFEWVRQRPVVYTNRKRLSN